MVVAASLVVQVSAARSPAGGQPSRGPWPLKFYALTSTALYVAEEEFSVEASFVYLISPTCSVFETNLMPNSFELVTPQGVLHLHGEQLLPHGRVGRASVPGRAI